MSNDVTLPALGESVTEGTVTRWLKSVGDTVEVDEPLLEVSTDKVDTEIPSPVAGTLNEILVEEDDTVEVGAVLARIGDAGAAPAQESAPAAESAPAEQSAPAQESAPAPESAPTPQATASEPAQAEPASSPAAEAAAPSEQESAPASGGGGGGEDVTLPALGESVTEGTVTRWLKSVGDTVEVDEPLLEVSTDKVDTEIPSPVAGTLNEILVEEDDTVEVGAVLARIGDAGAAPAQESAPAAESAPAEQSAPAQESAPAPASAPAEQSAPAQESAPAPESAPAEQSAPAQESAPAPESAPAEQSAPVTTSGPEPEPAPGEEPAPTPETEAPAAASAPAEKSAPATQSASESAGSGYVTPIVRKLARERGVDLSQVSGSGVGGRIRKEDVISAAESAQAATPTQSAAPAAASESAKAPELVESELRGQTVKMTRIRKVTADKMMESLHGMAQLTSVIEVDCSKIWALRASTKDAFFEKHGVKLSFLPFFTKAVSEALAEHANVNASVSDDGKSIVYHPAVNLSIAVDTEKGLMLPTMRGADSMSLPEQTQAIADLAERARSGGLKADEISGGTFSVTNTGSVGTLFDTPVVPAPQAGILATCAIVKRAAVVKGPDGEDVISIRPMCYLPLSYDHRLVDGADAARFLQSVKKRIEAGAFEADLGL
ncbi:2-oxoglutarate dehydrogenase, E2 component, dihydrolipoamide succinyltransferase [Demequina sp. SO4-13]|uniref:2-oxoglutarate dehydrogenase, E2 component, dihydrolipoamide succinyltransferase n=1 Tax=Demequina sp. SO4-13 TaxID=3401027 RepID=UPI003AF4BB03